MTDTFRALCAELLEAVQLYAGLDPAAADTPTSQRVARLIDAMANTTAALAQPEPQGPGPDDVTQLYYKHGGGDGMYGGMGEVNFEEAITEALARWSRPAIEPVPGVEGADG